MKKKLIFFALVLNSFIPSYFLLAQSPEKSIQSKDEGVPASSRKFTLPTHPKTKFEPFTGKVSKSKVRLRLQPNYDGQVVKEIEPGDLFLVLNQSEDFFAVKPPAEFKAYVFRTFVLDDVVEGNRVNVRLKPDLDAPVVAQLNSGDGVKGIIDPANPKWLEINIPDSTHFYIAKEYVEKIGDADYLALQEKRREDVEHLLVNNELMVRQEMQKPFNQINVENIKSSYQRILSDYSDFPEAAARAKQDLAALQEAYTHKKVAYLESQSRFAASKIEDAQKLSRELQVHKTKIADLQQQIEQNRNLPPNGSSEFFVPNKPQALPMNMSTWLPLEESLFAAWSNQTGDPDIHHFYREQKQYATHLKGLIEPYSRPVKNKPGDYILVNPMSKLPMAYLYSTQVNLQDYVGHEITLRASPRPNNHFAYPAYYVLYVE